MNEIPKMAATKAGIPVAPSESQWQQLVAAKRQRSGSMPGRSPCLDVIIPVYQGYDETTACVFAAVSTTLDEACEIVVINDAGPDRKLVEELVRWAGCGLFSLEHNDENMGFVRTVNHGMSLHGDRDVVLLNSDAIVYGDWLARLKQVAESQPKVATVTPFSNNAEICSYPLFVTNNHVPLEIDDETLDALAAECNASAHVAIPTGVGFCMYIRRACLDEIGDLDAKKFGKGYGEENDFCLRATSKGWVHLLATNVFVRHCGGVSFGPEKGELVLNGLRVLARDWPNYDRDIQKFLAADSVFPARRALDAARVMHAEKNRRTMLFVTHDWGGGVERHVQEMIAMLRADGVGTLVMRVPRQREGWVAFDHVDVPRLPNLQYEIASERASILAFLRQVGVFHIHVHSFAGFPMDAGEFVTLLATDLGVAYDFTAHDYLPICPRITMINETGVYCGDPSEDDCARCIAKNGTPVPVDSVANYRKRYVRFLRGARCVFAPSEDTRQRYEKWFPFLDVVIRPHLHDFQFVLPPPVRYRGEGILRVAVIGAIGRPKGSSLLLACARDVQQRNLPIRFVVFGITDNPELDAQPVVTVTGGYNEGEVGVLLKQQRCHLAFFASVWPETWSYTLSEAFDAGLFPVAFNLGAIAERIRTTGWGQCLPTSLMTDAAGVNDALVAVRAKGFTPDVKGRIRASNPIYPRAVCDYYGLAD